MTAKLNTEMFKIDTEAEIKQKSKDLVKFTEFAEHEYNILDPVSGPKAIEKSASKSFFNSVKGKDLYVQFAGQCVAMYANDLKSLIGNSHARPLLEKACASLKALEQDEHFASELPQGLDFLQWSVSTWPDLEYLNSAPVAYPLITLTQLAQFLVTMQELGVTKAEDISFAGGFGHSSGVISAAIVALASSVEEFEKLAVEAVMLQAVHGLRCTQHFPSIKLPISIWREHYVRWKPTPMLHVKHGGLPRNKAYLSEVIETHNKHAETKQRHLSVGLMNGTASVVCGAAESLHWLYEHLTKDAGVDQGRIPFSSRKIVLKVQFLDTGVPFHSFHLKDAAKDILADVAKRADLSSIRELANQNASFKFPVYNTCDGERMDKFDLAKLITLQTTEALDWVKTTNVLAANPGYVLDFGPQTAIATMTQFLH
jgi:fatty acid synthase subunit beta